MGFLEIAAAAGPLWERPDPATLARIEGNAHVRRALADPAAFDGFWVFIGTQRSARLRRAVPVTRGLAGACLRDATGAPWVWGGRSEAQITGSSTRTCRCVIDPEGQNGSERWAAWWSRMVEANPGLMNDGGAR